MAQAIQSYWATYGLIGIPFGVMALLLALSLSVLCLATVALLVAKTKNVLRQTL